MLASTRPVRQLLTSTRHELDGVGIESDVRSWLAENWSSELTLREWWRRLAGSGFGFPRWPIGCFGAGMDKEQAGEVTRVFRAGRVIGAPTGLGTLMGGPVVTEHGTDEQRRRLLLPLADGTEGWCQLFSEPGAGSDLASVSTKATRDGDEWVVTGQKVWTSGAMHSRRGMLIARTDVDQPKHRGLTYFVIDLDQPGVEIRPLHQMNGRSHFSEVFFTDARVHDRDRIGPVNGGWAVTVSTLQHERAGLSAPQGGIKPPAGEKGGFLDRTIDELLARPDREEEVDETEPGSFATLLRLARGRSLASDPVLRQGLAMQHTQERIAEFSQLRGVATAQAGRAPGPESSIAKLYWTQGLRTASSLSMRLLGPWGTLMGAGTPEDGRIQTFVLSVPSASIAGGSDEIQRNTPFRDLRKS